MVKLGVGGSGCGKWRVQRVVIEEFIKKLSREKGMAYYRNYEIERPESSLGLHTRLGL